MDNSPTISILIVVVGTHFIVLMKYSLGEFIGAAGSGMKVLFFKSPNYDELIEKIVELADMARKSGLLALEGAEIEEGTFKIKGYITNLWTCIYFT